MVRAGGAVIGESRAALVLEEPGHDPVVYFPRADIGMAFLDPSETRTRCPHKGEARYFHIAAKSGRSRMPAGPTRPRSRAPSHRGTYRLRA